MPSKPGLVLSDWTGGATLAPITTRIRRIPSEVVLGTDDGMPRECAANLDSIITTPRSCLRERLASLSPERLKGIENAIHFALGLEKRAIASRRAGHVQALFRAYRRSKLGVVGLPLYRTRDCGLV